MITEYGTWFEIDGLSPRDSSQAPPMIFADTRRGMGEYVEVSISARDESDNFKLLSIRLTQEQVTFIAAQLLRAVTSHQPV